MKLLSVSEDDIKTAARALARGALVAFPTETVYGLGADAFNEAALARVFEVKRRPRFDPLIIHIAALDGAFRIVCPESLFMEDRFRVLAARFWPGPLTLILPKAPAVPDLATSGLPTAAIRFPDHPAARSLIALSGGAVAAPSANLFGRLSPTRAAHVQEQLGEAIDYLIDGGNAAVGVESTVLDLSAAEPRILRPGGVSREEIEAVIGPVAVGGSGAHPASPGMMKSHYAPNTPLALYGAADMAALPYRDGAGYVFFSGKTRAAWEIHTARETRAARKLCAKAPNVRTLSEAGNGAEAAARLFSVLHEMDRGGFTVIHAEAAPPFGLGPAINDRLMRAAQTPPGSADVFTRE
jgi:L-threonylcarbamoyladenylate synthase